MSLDRLKTKQKSLLDKVVHTSFILCTKQKCDKAKMRQSKNATKQKCDKAKM